MEHADIPLWKYLSEQPFPDEVNLTISTSEGWSLDEEHGFYSKRCEPISTKQRALWWTVSPNGHHVAEKVTRGVALSNETYFKEFIGPARLPNGNKVWIYKSHLMC
jgi:hypothetical protein